jgi:hypothetical protein
MNSEGFLRIVDQAFTPFLERLGFVLKETDINGRFYEASFTAPDFSVSVSYEPGDDALFVMVFSLIEGHLSDIDDTNKTPRLKDLNRRYMEFVTPEERIANQSVMDGICVNDDAERQLVKCAKDLSLVLPKYLSDQRSVLRN